MPKDIVSTTQNERIQQKMNEEISYPGKPEEDAIQSKLAPPGAGIPFPAKIVLRFFVKPFVIRKLSWEKAQEIFRKNHRKVCEELDQFKTDEELSKRVLVDPMRGLEDSSRSVGTAISEVIICLSQEKTFPIEADLAKMKPKTNAREEVGAYKTFGDELITTIEERIRKSGGSRTAKETHVHPWFGAMTAHEYFCLLGIHTGIHLKQLREIRRKLAELKRPD